MGATSNAKFDPSVLRVKQNALLKSAFKRGEKLAEKTLPSQCLSSKSRKK